MEKRDLLLQIVHMYYGLGMTQEKIARQLFFSRSRISHLITEAEECGLVTFEIRQHISQNNSLQRFLCRQFHLRNAFVVDCSIFPKSEHFDRICKTAAEYLCTQLREDTVLNVSRGHTLHGIVHNMRATSPIPSMRVVQTEGMLLTGDIYLEQLDFVRRIADMYACQYDFIMLPYLFDSPELKHAVTDQSFPQDKSGGKADINLICSSISSLQQWRKYIRDDEYDWLVSHGAVGSIEGNFFDIEGNFLHSALEQRCIIPPISVLQNAEQLICVCNGFYKAKSLLGVLRTGLVDTLITNTKLAAYIEQMTVESRNSMGSGEDGQIN